MKKCPNDHENRDDAKYCAVCGKPIAPTGGGIYIDKFSDINFIVTDYRKYRKFHPAVIVVGFLGYIPGIIMLCLESQLRAHSDFIENTPSRFKRIAKNGKLGLFDSEKKVVCLPTSYDKIDIIDDSNYSIQRRTKKGVFNGIYNVINRRIIDMTNYS